MEKQPRNMFYLFNLSFVSAVKTLIRQPHAVPSRIRCCSKVRKNYVYP